MRQILYVSLSTVPGDKADLVGILDQSRHNNALDGITGLLWSDGRSFLQVFEGPQASVASTFARISADRRHHSLTIIEDRAIKAPEFGTWTMMHRRANDALDAYDARIGRILLRVTSPIRMQFLALVATGRPAAQIAKK
ncbi:BLUF domain-containing protein [Sphingomonas sp. PB4P5]|uniref:BLUF domain-containing protein n=1 Tax=Parasphingomonas puruogangriensis TaxID=3096155 RepID=UPI002FC81F8F